MGLLEYWSMPSLRDEAHKRTDGCVQGADGKLGQTLWKHHHNKLNSQGGYILMKISGKVYMHIILTFIY